MSIEFKELPSWIFIVDEVSAGVYKVFGKDAAGRNVEAIGTDPDSLLEQCKQYALQIMGTSEQ